MSEETPTLGIAPNEAYQWIQAINGVTSASAALRQFVVRARARRAREGRLANSDGEDAARQQEAQRHPPLRLMSDDEQLEWQQRVPSELAAQQAGEPFSAFSAQMVNGQGVPTGEWGVEATAWAQGAPAAKLMVVCRDAEDAMAMTHHLRANGSSEHFGRLHELAARAPAGQYIEAPAPAAGPQAHPGGRTSRLVLSEDAWEAALRQELPAELADKIIIRDPKQKEHWKWRDFHEMANEEVLRVGADPAELAKLVRKLPTWDSDVRSYPAIGKWALGQARGLNNYENIVAPGRAGGTPSDPGVEQAPAAALPSENRTGTTVPPRLSEVRSPRQARTWAEGLNPRDRTHGFEAEFGFGQWGADIDNILASKFPYLVDRVNAAAKKERDRDAVQAGQLPAAEPTIDPATQQELLAEVDRLDPAKPVDRRVAHAMLGKPIDREGRPPSELDRRIIEKFADDPGIAEKVSILYPDGLPEAEAAAWRNRAQGDDAAAATERAQPDDPQTPQREDVAAEADAQGNQGVADQRRGIAHTVAGQQPAVVRRTTGKQPQPAQGPARRS